MTFSKLGLAKMVITGIVGIGTGKIVGQIIKAHVKPENVRDKVTIVAASFVIGSLVTKAAKDHTNDIIDEAVGGVNQLIDWYKLKQKIDRINRGESTLEKEGLDPTDFIQNEQGKWEPIKDETIMSES